MTASDDQDRKGRETVLISAYSFAPRQGSESGTGWNTARMLSVRFNVVVVCDGHYRQFFQEYDFVELDELGVEVVFFEAERFAWVRTLPGRGMFWTRVHYLLWQREAKEIFRSLIETHRPIVVQHVTWGTGRVASQLTELGVPVIFGPVGGFEGAHWPLCRSLPIATAATEWIRNYSIRRATRSTSLKRMYSKVDLALACTPETATAMKSLGAKRIEIMSNAGVTLELIDRLRVLHQSHRREDPVFTMLFVGRMVGLKGIEFALRAAAKLPDSRWKLILVGGGEEVENYRELCKELQILNQVEITGWLPQEETWTYYISSDIFIFPSLHESGGNAAVEAMAAGLPVICLNQGGPGFCVGEGCGRKIPVGTPDEVILAMTDAMEWYRSNPMERSNQGDLARQRALLHFTWEGHGKRLVNMVSELGLSQPEI